MTQLDEEICSTCKVPNVCTLHGKCVNGFKTRPAKNGRCHDGERIEPRYSKHDDAFAPGCSITPKATNSDDM